MKKGVLTLGLISTIVFLVGIVFKKLHYPGAGVLMLLGVLLGMVFLIFFLSQGAKLLKAGTERLSGTVAAFTMLIILTGFVFKAQHWPGGQALLVASHVALLISSIILWADAFTEKEAAKQNIKGLIAFIYFIFMSLLVYFALLFDGFQPPKIG